MSEAFRIVVPTDFSKGSSAVLDWVKKLTKENNAEVHCVNVVQQPMVYMPVMAGTAAASMPSVDELQAISQKSLETFIEKNMGDLDQPAIAKILVGRPADEIAGYAEEIGAQMIVIATQGHSALGHALLGSTAEGVVRLSQCPVLTVHG